MVAKKLLDRKEGEIAQGKLPGVLFEKVTFNELADELIRDYQINGKKSLKRAKQSVNHLTEFFDGYKAVNITTTVIKSYIEKRLEENAANATINRDLSALKRMLNLGAQQTPPAIDKVPFIPMMKENNTRKGFFEYHEFLALRDVLPPYLKGFVTFAYRTGWRIKEISNLRWANVDRNIGIIRIEVGETKNDEGRTVFLDNELKEVIDAQWQIHVDKCESVAFVFPNKDHTGQIKSIRKAWDTALVKAGLEPMLFHDFRGLGSNFAQIEG